MDCGIVRPIAGRLNRWRIQFNPGVGGCLCDGYLITLSALASTFGGIVRPICLAVLRLITSSNFVGCSTGMSAGFVPFENLVDHKRSALVAFGTVGSIGHQTTAVDKISWTVNRRQPIFCREVDDPFSIDANSELRITARAALPP